MAARTETTGNDACERAGILPHGGLFPFPRMKIRQNILKWVAVSLKSENKHSFR